MVVCCVKCRDFEVCEVKSGNKPCCSYCEEYDACCALEDRKFERFIWLEEPIKK